VKIRELHKLPFFVLLPDCITAIFTTHIMAVGS
jgi:hypothetical protein